GRARGRAAAEAGAQRVQAGVLRDGARVGLQVRRLNPPRTVVEHLDLYLDVRVLELRERLLRPLDELHARPGQDLGDADLQPFAAVVREAVAVDVDDEWAAGDGVLVDDREGGRGHLAWVGAELRGDGAGQERLAAAEVSDEVDDGVRSQGAGDLPPGGGGF